MSVDCKVIQSKELGKKIWCNKNPLQNNNKRK